MKWLLIIFLSSISSVCFADINVDTTYNTTKTFSENDWQGVTKNHNYPKLKSLKKSTAKNPPFQFHIPGWLKYFFFILLAAILVILIYKLVNNMISPYNKSFEAGMTYEELDEESFFDENVLEGHLKEALRIKDYRHAIRCSYLISLRELSVSSLIVPSKDKTNYEYLQELYPHPLFGLFSEIIRSFEKTWYGEIIPEPVEYFSFEEKFNRFCLQLNSDTSKNTN